MVSWVNWSPYSRLFLVIAEQKDLSVGLNYLNFLILIRIKITKTEADPVCGDSGTQSSVLTSTSTVLHQIRLDYGS